METRSNLWLHSISVVVTAQSHNPSILTPDFLVSQGIIPQAWKATEMINTPPLARVAYDNRVSWTMTQDTLTLAEEWNGPFGNLYTIHRLMSKYLEVIPHVPYRSLGLNCAVSTNRRNPDKWLTDRFLNPDARPQTPGLFAMEPRFIIGTYDAVIFMSARVGLAQRTEGVFEDAIITECNVHHEGPLGAAALIDAINRWPERQDSITDVLDQLFETDLV